MARLSNNLATDPQRRDTGGRGAARRGTRCFGESQAGKRIWLAVLLTLPLLPACASQSHYSALIDPDAFGTDQGTLISARDVRTVAEVMVQSLNGSSALAARRLQAEPIRVLVGTLKQRTSIPIFDKEIFLNRLLSRLKEADQDGVFLFLRREPVFDERVRQLSGTVASDGVAQFAGAEFVLNGELRELFVRRATDDGGELQKRTIQYTLSLDRVNDAARVWAHSHEVVKAQVIGAVYR